MEEKERYESKYNEKLMKHYAFDNENKEELGYKGVVRVLNQQDKKIKAKEKEASTYAKEIVFLDNKIKLLERENRQLKQQLEEKEKEIAYLTKQVKKFNNEAQKYFEDAYCNDFHNQDKISFAVEVLKIAQDYVQQYVNNFDDMNDCLCAIDNQIKSLKGE